MSATQIHSPVFEFDPHRVSESVAASSPASALAGLWYVIAASQGSISRNPRNATETFELSGTRLVSSLRFERLGGSAATTRRRIFDLGESEGLLSLIQTSLDIVFVDETQAVVAEGRRLRILSRTPEISPRDFFRRVSLSREKGHDADDLRMIPIRRG